MFLKFYTDTIESSFIKLLLHSIYLPTIKTCHYMDYVCKDFKYIYDLEIIYVTKSGFIGDLSDNGAKYNKLDEYIPNRFEPTYTQRFYSTYNFYDSETHRYLGQYLRWYRDIYGIDLMPFYNCFDYEFTDNVYISDRNKLITGKNSKYKQFLIPIDSNRDYTIALNSTNIIKLKPVFYNKYGILGNIIPETEVIVKLFANFNKPFIYNFNILNYNETLLLNILKNERYLYLLIQIPASLNTSIIVLEGNYINSQLTLLFEGEYNLISKLSLLRFNLLNIYAFSNKLIEYLLGNVITGQDIFNNDILTVLKLLNIPINSKNPKSIWTYYLRKHLFNKYMSLKDTSFSKVDINGFVDKNMEKALMEGKLK